MSGLQIFNAHPALYWGHAGANPSQALFEIGTDGPRRNPAGFTRVGASTFDTTGILGVSRNANGQQAVRAFPRWMTVPSWRDLGLGRKWHFFFAWLFAANLLLYLLATIVSGHLRRDLLPAPNQLRPSSLFSDISDHLRLKFPRGDAARHYNPLQKLSYLVVIFVLLPVMVLTGLSMSPGMDAIFPWLVDLFGGRQSARTIHFIAAGLILLFVSVHIIMVILAGPRNELRSMITGNLHFLPATTMHRAYLDRRQFLSLGTTCAGGLLLAGCDRLSEAPNFQKLLSSAEWLTFRVQRLVGGSRALAREFGPADISPVFKVNGTRMPDSEEYAALRENNFADWRLRVDGLVVNSGEYSLADLQTLPQRTQITRHDCVEGWSAIGKWQGVPLAFVLTRAQLLPTARFIVFHCADTLEQTLDGTGQYYESLDLIDAFHAQTILAHSLNDAPLSIGHGAPLRLRVERQLGYKQAKYLMRIEVTERLDDIGRGRGGFWEDRGYEWYAGI